MRVMGLDLGEQRVGVALSDESQTLATPFEIVRRVSFVKLTARLKQIVAAQHVEALVIGFPRSLNGQIGPQAQHVADEAERLRKQLNVPVTLWDERMTTVRAMQMLDERGKRPRHGRQRKPVDAIVAAMILQEYLDAQHVAPEA